MISAPSSQAHLARAAFRGASTTSRLVAASRPQRLVSALVAPCATSQPSRSFSLSPISRQDAAAAQAASESASASEPTPPSQSTSAQDELSTERNETESLSNWVATDKPLKHFQHLASKYVLKWGWFDEGHPQRRELAKAFARDRDYPNWLKSTYDLAKSFRTARARLWTPAESEVRALGGADAAVSDVPSWIDDQIEAVRETLQNERRAAWDAMEYEQQTDFVLRRVWERMSHKQRDAALLRLRYECIRKLGWRQGYSSGYPRPESEQGTHLPAKLGARGDEGWAAFRKLQQAEDELAWKAWQELSPGQRTAEEAAAWKLRDRSHVYIDDADDSFILASPAQRWYAEPERAGELTFLPNTIVKLVKNYTPPGAEYDAFKATFRVPLSMHKHALRSYLSAIYGLKTTWARSAIYRSPQTRDNRTGKKISGRGRTYKKVEVGLLEPFLFPEVSPDFQKQFLLTSELDYERARVYLKMTKSSRWRAKKTVEQYEHEIGNKEATMYHGLAPLASEGIKDEGVKEAENFPRFMVKTKGLPSAKHGKILQLLAQERKQKEDRINQLIDQYKRDAAISS